MNSGIAKNTFFLYFRMLVSMLMGLYTSRVVLLTLGVEDFGLYGVVGGVVAMMSFINSSMSGATSRYITFELGRGDEKRMSETFSSAFIVHVMIAVLIVVLAETVGLWFFLNKLNIPEERGDAAMLVYQLSIVSAVIGITQTPYAACVIAHERMNLYAYLELLNVTLKFVVVCLLVLTEWDKLIVYAVLMLAVTLVVQMLYRLYCVRHFKESRLVFVWNKETLKSMLVFSFWDLYGNMSFSVVQQGRNFILNVFFGVLLNTASGIATTVQGVIQGFSTNVIQAFRPQIIKLYAANDISRMESLMISGMKITFVLLSMVSVPLMFEIHYVLKIWLGIVPAYVESFCLLLLLQNMISVPNSFFAIGLHASTKVKFFAIGGTVSLLQLPVLYVVFKQGYLEPSITYVISVIIAIINDVILGVVLKNIIKELKMGAFCIELVKVICICGVCCVPLYYICQNVEESFVRLLTLLLLYVLLTLLLSYVFVLEKGQRQRVKGVVKRIFCR